MDTLVECVEAYLRELTAHEDRHVGGSGNHAATKMFARVMKAHGIEVERSTFECVEWRPVGASLMPAERPDQAVETHVGPYSLPYEGHARLFAASSIDELEEMTDAWLEGCVLLLHGDVASGQLMPKSFEFYDPEAHKRIYRAIEAARPAAVVAATGYDPEMVGAQYPFPLFEDGGFDIPNAYVKDVDGEGLLEYVGRDVELRIDSERVPATGEHLVCTKHGTAEGRIVIFAHIDSRRGSPGALDNAAGVAALLGLGSLLSDYGEGPDVEIVPLNGEDDWANPGEMLWLAQNGGRMGDIVLGINLDDVGAEGEDVHVSFYGVEGPLTSRIREAVRSADGFDEGPAWPQGDHGLFIMNGVPAVALASSGMHEFMANHAHTERDTLDLVDPVVVVGVASFLRDLLGGLVSADWLAAS